ncbi:hypothetical protein BDV93DRAFT_609179 [Ceratobasidium sp. AG-I]|nr:hypothetical protein BDV93DRAFT_609179 [Ceratobasidium sp. AG-I]
MASELLPPDIFKTLFERETPPPLRPTSVYAPDLTSRIANLEINGVGAPVPVQASLYLLNDDIKSAYAIAEPYYDQGIYTCDYPHAMLHIRDGDYGNSRWWFRRLTGNSHPMLVTNFSPSPEGSKELTVEQAGRLAKKMVDECQEVGTGTSDGLRLEKELYRHMKAVAEWSIQEFVIKGQE